MNFKTSYSDAFNKLHEMFGIGDEVNGEIRYAREVAKLRAMCSKRSVPPERLLLTAEYCQQHKIPITATWQLFQHISPALVEMRQKEREERRRNALMQLQEAAGEAYELEQDTWGDRLLRVTPGKDADQLLAEWHSFKEQISESQE